MRFKYTATTTTTTTTRLQQYYDLTLAHYCIMT